MNLFYILLPIALEQALDLGDLDEAFKIAISSGLILLALIRTRDEGSGNSDAAHVAHDRFRRCFGNLPKRT